MPNDTFSGSSNLIYTEEQLSGASGFFDDFKVTGDLAVGGNLFVSGKTFVQSVTDVSVTGDISGYAIEGISGIFDVVTGGSGLFSDQLTISGQSVLTGVETGNFVTTGFSGLLEDCRPLQGRLLDHGHTMLQTRTQTIEHERHRAGVSAPMLFS